MPIGRRTWPDPRHRSTTLIAAAVLAALLAAGAGGWAAMLRADAARLEQPASWARLLRLVHQTQAATEDELNLLARHALEAPESGVPQGRAVAEAAAARAGAVRTLVDELTAQRDDPTVGWAAQALLGVYEPLPDSAEGRPPLPEIIDVNDRALRRIETAAATDDRTLALLQLVEHASLPRLVLNDVLDTRYVSSDSNAAPWAAEYFDGAAGYLATEPGWLAADAAEPLASPYIEADELREHLPRAWSELMAVGGTREGEVLVAVDEWVRGWSAGASGPPPHPLEETAVAADAVAAAVDALVVDTADDVIASAEAAAQDAGRTATAAMLLAAVLGAGAAVLALVVASHRRGRTRAWRSAALNDDLTGLANRRGLTEHADRTAEGGTTGHALLLFDVDHFKGINDRYGHAVGDAVLMALADRVRAVAEGIPGEALVARLGGDEFVLLASAVQHPAAAGEDAAAQLVQAVRETPVAHVDVEVPMSISVGIAATTGALSLEDLLLQADMALYDVKRSGRGRHQSFTPDQPLAGA